MFSQEVQNYYEVLDLKPDATQNDIRQAYLRVKSAYGKDSVALYSLFDDVQTKKVLDEIEQAYHVLSNPEKRKEYDKVHGFLELNIPEPTPEVASFTFSAKHQSHHELPVSTKPLSMPSVEPASQPSRKPVEYVINSDFAIKENNLGIIRRNELSKTHTKNSELEDEIAREEQFRGAFLKKIREYKNISIDEMADFTKISRSYLNCIESEEFESLPAPAYIRGFVIQIAKALKIPHEKAALGYMTYYKSTLMK